MPQQLTQADVDALVAQGWWYTDVYIGGRGYVQLVTNGRHTYEQSGVDRWWLVQR